MQGLLWDGPALEVRAVMVEGEVSGTAKESMNDALYQTGLGAEPALPHLVTSSA